MTTTNQQEGGRSMARRLNEQAVLDAIFSRGPASRVDVAEMTGLSKPTVSAIVEEMVAAGLVHSTGRTQGNVGRTAVLYEVNPAVGHVVGVDLGGTKVRAALCDMFGTILAERVRPTDPAGPDAVIAQIQGLAAELAGEAEVPMQTVAAMAVATPGTVDPGTAEISLAYNIPSFAGINLAERLEAGSPYRVVIDNDVNMAAVGERWQGLARHCDNFAFLAVGTGIGMGLMLNGEIWQGLGGMAGEIGYMPLGRDPFDPATRERGALEEAGAGRGIVARYLESAAADQSGAAEMTAEMVFDAARGGDPRAIDVIDEEARLLALAITAVNAVIAPELVVLGGGIGANPLLLEPLSRYVEELVPNSNAPTVRTSALEHRASLIGSLAIALQTARTVVFGGPPGPLIVERSPGKGTYAS
jgi:predicted NBD/HSP70 family sugar kinase